MLEDYGYYSLRQNIYNFSAIRVLELSDNALASEARFIGGRSDVETLPPTQRRYTVAYKLRPIGLAVACTGTGELASLLRQEGVYSSTLAEFCKQ